MFSKRKSMGGVQETPEQKDLGGDRGSSVVEALRDELAHAQWSDNLMTAQRDEAFELLSPEQRKECVRVACQKIQPLTVALLASAQASLTAPSPGEVAEIFLEDWNDVCDQWHAETARADSLAARLQEAREGLLTIMGLGCDRGYGMVCPADASAEVRCGACQAATLLVQSEAS